MVILHLHITPFQIGILEAIGRTGKASSGYSQNAEFCINKAIEEFIVKYTGKDEYDWFELIEKELRKERSI